ncbi:MAG: HEPN domain-containing protein, partial [Gammaproteobacteria bacterium]|nr:HEPN domain-containing protein [Gammaproteobacteria bacterium]
FTASRAYYAVFYAASALLLNEQMDTSKHSGVISLINQYFVKTGRLDKQYGKMLKRTKRRGLDWQG